MSADLYPWIRIAHILGFLIWIGGLLTTLSLLDVHARVEAGAREALTRAERSAAVIMDIGATLAIGAGLYLALASPRFPRTAFHSGGWFRIKLTIVVLVILALHGLARAKVKKFSKGEVKPIPSWAVPLLLVAAAAIVVLAAHPTLLKK